MQITNVFFNFIFDCSKYIKYFFFVSLWIKRVIFPLKFSLVNIFHVFNSLLRVVFNILKLFFNGYIIFICPWEYLVREKKYISQTNILNSRTLIY